LLTNGEAYCYNDEIGFCEFDYTCDEVNQYYSLWDSYSFKISFEGNTNYLVIPLAAFAKPTYLDNGDEYCTIFV
jgi:hypothetical protein